MQNFLSWGLPLKRTAQTSATRKLLIYITHLKEYTDDITVLDPWANPEKTLHEYNIQIEKNLDDEVKYDAIILAVAHKEFLNIDLKKHLNENGVIYDVKGILDRNIIDGRL